MTFTLSKNQLHLIGVGIILLFAFLYSFDFYWGSSTTTGKVTAIKTWWYKGSLYTEPIIEFKVNDQTYTFDGETNTVISPDEIIPVIYKTNNPAKAKIYTFQTFWLPPILYTIAPLLIYSALVLAFFKSSYTFRIGKKSSKEIMKIES